MADPEIPDFLLSKLQGLRHVLERYGSVLLRPREGRRRGGYRLRYWNKDAQGCRHHRSMVLGDEPMTAAVKLLIDGWRQEFKAAKAAKQAADAAARKERREYMEFRRAVQDTAGGGKRRRRVIVRLYDEADKEGGFSLWTMMLCLNTLAPPGKRGRPRKGGLVLDV